jgi:hypothetical protein
MAKALRTKDMHTFLQVQITGPGDGAPRLNEDLKRIMLDEGLTSGA